MRSKHINDVNEAILVLRHFIELSAKLLPFLEELECKRVQTIEDRLNKQKIIDVYRNYDFDTNTSVLLMNSNVLELIRDSFDHICNAECARKRRNKSQILRRFLSEHERLRENWGWIQAN